MEFEKQIPGAELLVEALRINNVDLIFGYPGGAVLPLYDTFHDLTDIKHILVRHEQGATHMAEGYTRSTGKVGIVVVTSGPGATNTITGIADAFADSLPMVVISGQVPRGSLGQDSFQETDVIGITRPITKWNYLVRSADQIGPSVHKAFEIATSGRPGPVLLDIPKDVFLEKAPLSTAHQKKQAPLVQVKPNGNNNVGADKELLKNIAKKINGSKRPLIYFGGGVINSHASEELRSLAFQTGIPVTSTLHGLGGFPGTHPQFLGMLGMHGTYLANRTIDECDLLLAIGARFDDRVTGDCSKFSPNSYKIHFEIDPSNVDKSIKVDLPVYGNLKTNLKNLLPLVNERLDLGPWWGLLDIWKTQSDQCFSDNESSEKLRVQRVLKNLSEKLKGEAIVTTDVGQNQMWAAQLLTFNNPNSHITSGGLGTMGFSLPAGIGASLGNPTKKVVSISGDGGFQMNIQELTTARAYGLPIIFIILNNSFLGMVRQWQELFFEERFSYTNLEETNPDFIAVSEGMGVPGKKIQTEEQLEEGLQWALNFTKGPCLLEIIIQKEEMVFPIIPSGGQFKDIIMERFNHSGGENE